MAPRLLPIQGGACNMAEVIPREVNAHRRSESGFRGAQERTNVEKPDIKRPPNPDLPEFNDTPHQQPNGPDGPAFGEDVADRPEPDEGGPSTPSDMR